MARNERYMENVLDEAEVIFWDHIAKAYPEVVSGDFMMVTEWHEMNLQCLKHWLALNMPPPKPSVTLASANIIIMYFEYYYKDGWVSSTALLHDNNATPASALMWLNSKYPDGVRNLEIER